MLIWRLKDKMKNIVKHHSTINKSSPEMSRWLRILSVLCCVLIFSLLFQPIAYASTPSTRAWRSFQQGIELRNAGRLEEALTAFRKATEYMPENSSYQRNLGELLERMERFEEAADAFEREAAIRRKAGEIQAALVQERRASSLRSEIKLFVQLESQRKPSSAGELELYEPPAGLYFGVFVEQDRNVGRNNQGQFNDMIGKPHAIFFNYHPYGAPFPHNWARIAKNEGAAIHLALEPEQGLEMVHDNEYLRQFARMARAAEVPVFLRFASEMNGDWVRWHGNPKLYIEKWRIVANVMREEAPNVAMVWTPNSVPVTNIKEYYPGDNYVDWVGVNLYSVAYFDGDRNRPAYNVNPLDLIRPIYEMFADRKPIQVSEFGATHFTTATNRDTTQFAITKMLQLYHGVQMLFPRVKNINWFSMNTITEAAYAHRRLNNFSLTENSKLKQAYREMLEYPYFLTQVVNGPFAQNASRVKIPVPIRDAGVLSGQITLQSWAATYDPFISRLEYTLNGQMIGSRTTKPYSITIDTTRLTEGMQTLSVTAFDSRGRAAVTRTFNFKTTGGLPRRERSITLTIGKNEAVIDGQQIGLSHPPRLMNRETFVPIRFISENIGSQVNWESGRINIRRGSGKIVINSGSMVASVNGAQRNLSQPPLIERGVTFVPLRFIAEAFGAQVRFERGIITIRIPNI